MRWLSGRASDSESRGPGFDPHRAQASSCCVLKQDAITPYSTGETHEALALSLLTEKLLTGTLSLNTPSFRHGFS